MLPTEHICNTGHGGQGPFPRGTALYCMCFVCLVGSLVPRRVPTFSICHDCLQYANTEGGRPGRSGHEMTSGRQMVDTEGWCLTIIMLVSCRTIPANALASTPWTDRTRNGLKFLCQVPPPMCLPSVYLT